MYDDFAFEAPIKFPVDFLRRRKRLAGWPSPSAPDTPT